MMRKSTIITTICILFLFNSNELYAQCNAWTEKEVFGGGGRWLAVGFSIGDKGYIGTGSDSPNNKFKDFWEYDPLTNTWTQKADFGGDARNGAVGFSIGNKGYIGTGRDTGTVLHNDFWEYDPTGNTWIQKANFGGIGRRAAVGFSIGNKGYLGSGINDSSGIVWFIDFWEYDPLGDAWTQKADYTSIGSEVYSAVGFSISGKGYIGTGGGSTWPPKSVFLEYDPTGNSWTQKADFGGEGREGAVGFSIGTKGYIGTGYVDGMWPITPGVRKDFWEYDPLTDEWIQKEDLGGNGRQLAVGFSIGSKGYIGTGGWSIKNDDFWEYDPSIVELSLSLDSTAESCNGANDGTATVTVSGGTTPYVYSWSSGGASSTESNLGNGSYTVTVTDGAGCNTIESVTIIAVGGPTASTTSTNATCGNADGSATVTVNGGSIPYSYLWSSGGSGSTESSLAVGNYTVTVTDAGGCIVIENASISEIGAPSVFISSGTNASCNGCCDGTAVLSVTGGTLPYTYLWNDPSNQTTATATGLCAGPYDVTVTGADNCSGVALVAISEPVGIIASYLSIGLKVYPNPSSGEFIVEIEGYADRVIALQVINTIGQLVFEDNQKQATGDYHKVIELKGEAKGVYQLLILTETRKLNHRIILE